MGSIDTLKLIAEGRFFQFATSTKEVEYSPLWLCALVNESDTRIMLHNIELYWDGGDVTPINKRECFVDLFIGNAEIVECNSKSVHFPDGTENEDIKYCLPVSEGRSLSLDIDPDDTLSFPVAMGKTKMSPYLILDPGDELFIGASAKVNGKISIIGKGFIYDQEIEDTEQEPGIEIDQ